MRSTFIPPCQPWLALAPPTGDDWIHELKFDGWRVQVHNYAERTTLYSRNGHDVTKRFEKLAALLRVALKTSRVIIDGELVAFDDSGMPDFWAVNQARVQARINVLAFDLMMLNGRELRPQPLIERRRRLMSLVEERGGPLRYSEDFSDASVLLAACEKMGMEGVVSKRLDAPYVSGPCKTWIKVKTSTWREANRDRWQRMVH